MYSASHIKDTGNAYQCTCPIHYGDNENAFVWRYDNYLWYCFTGCQCGGDVFDFIAYKNDLSTEHDFKQVVNKTAEILKLDISSLEIGERTNEHIKDTRKWIEFVSWKKKITQKQYDISLLGEIKDITRYKNYGKDIIDNFNIKYCSTINRLVVPIYDINGVCIGTTLRRIEETDNPKWLHRPKTLQTGNLLYNLNNILEYKFSVIHVVEGCGDVWNMYKIGHLNTVGCFGAHLTDEQEELLLMNFETIILAFDNDKAGRNATRKAIEKLKYKTNLFVLDLENHKDPGEIPNLEEYNKLTSLYWYRWYDKYGMNKEEQYGV